MEFLPENNAIILDAVETEQYLANGGEVEDDLDRAMIAGLRSRNMDTIVTLLLHNHPPMTMDWEGYVDTGS